MKNRFWLLWLMVMLPIFTLPAKTWNPEAFEETSKYAKLLAQEIIDALPLHGNESILDVGTGDGKVASVLSQKVPFGKVLAIDPSEEMIAYAKQTYAPGFYNNLSFESGDALHFPVSYQFDIITSFTVLHMVPDQEQAMLQFAKFLKPGGRLYCKFPVGDGFGMALKKVMKLSKWQSYFSGFQNGFQDGWYFKTKADYERYLWNAHLVAVRVENQILDEAYETVQEMKDAVREWLPHIQALPADAREKFLDDLMMLYIDEVPPDETGIFHHYEPSLCIEAVKCFPSMTP